MSQISAEVARVMFQIFLDTPHWKKLPPNETAVLVLPGMDQDYRVTRGAGLWPYHGQYLWVAGTRGDPYYSREQIVKVTGYDSPNIVCGAYARHTPDQMKWCCNLLRQDSRVKHILVATAAYHVIRCTLTLLATLEKANLMWPMITPIPLRNPSGDSFTSSEDFESEAGKILQYQESGDVASFEQWRRYLKRRLAT